MADYKLVANPRKALGKRVRGLRRQGILPVHLFGPHVESRSLQIDAHEFQRVWSHAGRLSLINLSIDGEQHTVLIKDVQRQATTDRLIHADLFAVAMTELLRATVPIVVVGESPAVKQGGVLLRALDSVEVESLPGDLPHQLDVDISHLAEMEAGIHVRDLVVPEGVTLLTSGDELVVKVAAPTVEVEEVEAVAAQVPPPPESLTGTVESGEEAEAGR